MTAPRHRFGEHTGEVELNVEADTLPALFEEAARGLAELLAEDNLGPPTLPEEHITLSSADSEALLVDWLNELIYRGEINKCIYADVSVDGIARHALEATVRGREPSSPRTAVKAATWHGVRIRSRGGRLDRSSPGSGETTTGPVEATVVLDV